MNNKDFIKVASLLLLLYIILCVVGQIVATLRSPTEKIVEVERVVERVDTIREVVTEQKVIFQEVVRYDTVFIPLGETAGSPKDSLPIVLPIERKVYTDNTYRAVVSGYKPNLESIEVYVPTKDIYYKPITIQEPAPRFVFCVGVQMGYGITPKGCLPYAGVGATLGVRFGNKRQK